METKETPRTRKVYQQATTGVLHARKNCSITRSTRYNHFERELTAVELAQIPKCAKCWTS
jgi:hypothetical protein